MWKKLRLKVKKILGMKEEYVMLHPKLAQLFLHDAVSGKYYDNIGTIEAHPKFYDCMENLGKL